MSEEFNEDEVNEAASCGKKVAKSVLNKIRAKHGMKEEVEDLEELSKDTLGRYAHKAKDQLSKAEYRAGVKMGERHMGAKPDSMERAYNVRANKRHAGLTMAIDKLAKEEADLEEGSYKDGDTRMGSVGPITTDAERAERAKKYREKMMKKEEVEDLEELSTDTLRKYREKARDDAFDADAVDDERRLRKRSFGHNQAGKKIIKRGDTLRAEETQECMIDTSLSDVKQSSKGEVYSKSNEKSTAAAKPTGTKTGVTAGKTGEAYNTTAVTKRMPAVENAVLDVMAKSLERRRIYQESTNIAIVSPEQRNDWMNVERGQMDVVSYFNKYKVTEED